MAKRILLVKADYPGSRYDYLNLPVGLGYISETLSRNGIEHGVFDLELNGGYGKLKKIISSYKPEIIGYSLMSFRYKHNYSILQSLKKSFPEIKIIAGGPHLSTFQKRALEDCQAIDIGVVMEGEEALLDLCRNKPLDEISGIIYRDKDGRIVQTAARNLIEDLDRIPFPQYKRFDLNSYPRIIPIVTSRGCPHQCIYCPIASVMGARFRARSPANVIDEIEFWYNKGVRDFSIADDVFNFIKERVYAICEEIEKRRLSSLRLCCSNGIRADKVDRDLLKRMKEVGFYQLAFGVESASDRVLETLKKGETSEKIEQAIREACQLGYWVELFFLIGSPGEVRADVEQSVRLALKYPIYEAAFYNLIPFPNTELYRWVEEKNYFLLPHPDYLNNVMHHVNRPIFTTPELNFKERKKAFRYAKSVINRHTKARRLRLERWLTKQKLRDYYGVKGVAADLIAWLYCHKWFARLIKFFYVFIQPDKKE